MFTFRVFALASTGLALKTAKSRTCNEDVSKISLLYYRIRPYSIDDDSIDSGTVLNSSCEVSRENSNVYANNGGSASSLAMPCSTESPNADYRQNHHAMHKFTSSTTDPRRLCQGLGCLLSSASPPASQRLSHSPLSYACQADAVIALVSVQWTYLREAGQEVSTMNHDHNASTTYQCLQSAVRILDQVVIESHDALLEQ